MDDFLNQQEALRVDVDQVHNATNRLAHAVSSLRSSGDIDYAHYAQELDATSTSTAMLALQNFLPEYRKKLAQWHSHTADAVSFAATDIEQHDVLRCDLHSGNPNIDYPKIG